jgi:O-antigen/teichoic acid export membrane protein
VGGLRLRYSHQLAKSLLSFGSKSHLSTASTLLNQRFDQLVISVFLAPTALGTYVVAVGFSSVPALAGAAIALVVFPMVARLQAGTARDTTACRSVQLTLFTSTVIAVVLMVTVHWLVGFLVGPAYRDAVNVARVLLVASVFLGMNSTLTALLKAVGRPLQAGFGGSLALLVTFAGLILFVPPYGIMGAAVVSLAAYAASATFMLQRAARELELPVGALLFTRGSRGSRFLLNEEFALAEDSPAHDLRRGWRPRKGSKS